MEVAKCGSNGWVGSDTGELLTNTGLSFFSS